MGAGRVVISGSSGLIGSALARSLERVGVDVVRLVRRPPRESREVQWHPGERALSPEVLAGAAAVVNLNGASIGRLPWTKRYREVLRQSRLDPTRTLADALRELGPEAPLFVSGSAVGLYGHRPGERLTESSGAGSTFLAQLSTEWEQAALTAGPHVRVAFARTAPLLHPQSVLKPLITLTRFGLSGPLGSGRQVWPWISLEDEVRGIRHIIDQRLDGPVNLTGPTPATATEIGKELARRMRRPYLLPAPAFALRLVLGRNAADSLLLTDANVEPQVLQQTGFKFTHPTPGHAIGAALDAQ